MHRALPLAIAALLAPVAVAMPADQPPQEQVQQPDGSPAELFIKQHDTDGDGKVSAAEAVSPKAGGFKETDTDGDGYISVEELRVSFESRVPPEAQKKLKEQGLPDPAEAILKKLDKNGDGKVDEDEFKQPTVEAFERMDTNSDGFVALDELEAFFGQMRERILQMQEQRQKESQQKAPQPAE